MIDLRKYSFRTKALSAVATVAALIILFIVVDAVIKFFSAKDWLSALGTLVASFSGALFAFMFAKYQRDRERIRDNVTAGNLALFIITQMYNETRQYQKEFVSPFRDRPDVWLNLYIGMRLTEDLSIDKDSVAFLLETKAATFSDIMLEESRFHLLANLIERHRQLVVSQLWPRLESAGLRIGSEPRPEQEIEEIVGPSVTQELKVMTKGIIDITDQNEESLKEGFRKLRSALLLVYPTKKFIDFKPETKS